MEIKNFIQSRSIGIYFGLAYILTWGGSIIAAGPKFLRGEDIRIEDLWLMGAFMLIPIALLGILMTYMVDGQSGLRDLVNRLIKWRVSWRWYTALLIFPILILVCQLSLAVLVSSEFLPTFFSTGIILGLFAGFLEEIGWTGFVYPRMKSRYTALTASLILGVVHVLWHFAAGYLGASKAKGEFWLPYFAVFCVSMVAMRVILSWVYVNTESLLLAQLMHASSSGFLSILVSISISPANDTLFYAVYSVVLWIAAAIIIVRYGKELNVKL